MCTIGACKKVTNYLIEWKQLVPSSKRNKPSHKPSSYSPVPLYSWYSKNSAEVDCFHENSEDSCEPPFRWEVCIPERAIHSRRHQWDRIMKALGEMGTQKYLQKGFKGYSLTGGVLQGSILRSLIYITYDGLQKLQIPGTVERVAFSNNSLS